jgi:hypothetical protein
MADRRLIDANALLATPRCPLSLDGDEHHVHQSDIDAAPTVVPDSARLRAIIEERIFDQGWLIRPTLANAIALAVDDIMEYLGVPMTDTAGGG